MTAARTGAVTGRPRILLLCLLAAGALSSWALDQLGVDDEDLSEPTETYVDGKACLDGSDDAAFAPANSAPAAWCCRRS